MKYLLIPLAAYILFPVALLFTLSSTSKMTELEAQVNELEEKLKSKSILVIGVQGGKGSFNELAAQTQMSEKPEQNFELKYLHTTENVLSALDKNEIEIGQFAVRNTLGGEVAESAEAMKRHKFEIVREFKIKVAHNLMIAPDATISDIKTIVAHPQAFKQCQKNLSSKYPKLKQFRGDGDLIDPSTWAEKLGHGKLDNTFAVLGNKTLAKLNKLKMLEENLQDSNENYTTFLWVKRQ
jgi:prephenate dehydratase